MIFVIMPKLLQTYHVHDKSFNTACIRRYSLKLQASLTKRMYVFLNKNIILAKHAGFCYGVKRAVETTKKIKSENPDKPVYVLGELIHNSDVINELDKLGIVTTDVLPSDNKGVCIIRSHGLCHCAIENIKNDGFEVVDLTCPDVKKVQQKAIELVKDGYLLVIVGKPEHPEVMAISANAKAFGDKVFVISDESEISGETVDIIKSAKRVGVVSQTTQRIANLQSIVSKLTSLSRELTVFNTICASTSLRQNEARELAQKSDLMIVVGSKKSANTTHLAEILKDITQTIHIENEKELHQYSEIIEKAENIGITAGASTPDNVISSVIEKLKNF